MVFPRFSAEFRLSRWRDSDHAKLDSPIESNPASAPSFLNIEELLFLIGPMCSWRTQPLS